MNNRSLGTLILRVHWREGSAHEIGQLRVEGTLFLKQLIYISEDGDVHKILSFWRDEGQDLTLNNRSWPNPSIQRIVTRTQGR